MKHSNRSFTTNNSSKALRQTSSPQTSVRSYSLSTNTSLRTSNTHQPLRSLRSQLPLSSTNQRNLNPTSSNLHHRKVQMSQLSTTATTAPAKPPTFAENDNLLILCDVQENFRPVMPRFNGLINATKLLLNASNVLKLPLIVSEQNPFKPTIEELSSIIHHRQTKSLESGNSDGHESSTNADGTTDDQHVYTFRKSRFSLVNEEVHNILNQVKPKRVVLFGLEAHVCILQTADDLLKCLDADLYKRPFELFLVTDATISQRDGDRDIAFRRLETAGVRLTTAESIVYEIMEDAKHPGFKQMLPFVKEHGAYHAAQSHEKH